MAVEVGGKTLAEGRGRTKKLAEQSAAAAALDIVEKPAEMGGSEKEST